MEIRTLSSVHVVTQPHVQCVIAAGDPSALGELPGTGGGKRAVVCTRSVALSPTGRSWAAATTGGVLGIVYPLCWAWCCLFCDRSTANKQHSSAASWCHQTSWLLHHCCRGRVAVHADSGLTFDPTLGAEVHLIGSPSKPLKSAALLAAEGVLLHSLDEGLVFDPTDLGAEVTPAAVHAAARRGAWLRAFLLALRLNQPELLRHVILSTPPQQVLTISAMCTVVLCPTLVLPQAQIY